MEAENGAVTNYKSLLFSENRDFLIRNNGDQVKALEGKTVGVYFSAHWCGPCRGFTPKLVEVYNEIKRSGGEFEVVFVSGDNGEEGFKEYFSEMPWLAVPFSDTASRETLDTAFEVMGIPHLSIINGDSGEMVDLDAVELVKEYGAEAFPFTKERLAQLKEKEEDAKRNQTVISVLATASRDFVLSADGTQVRVSELEGKMVAIYFSAYEDDDCKEFSPILSKMYSELKGRGEPFEVVLVSLDWDEDDYKIQTKEMPWLALPFRDSSIQKLTRYFEVETSPTLVLLGVDGKTLNENLEEVVEEHGASAYPFSSEKLAELAELERKRMDEQTLESLLVFDDLDYVLGKEGAKVPVKDLVGKTVLIYFSAHWCPPCRAFTPKLAKVYKELKTKQCEVEVIFVSSDQDQSSFDEYYSSMPWLALPYGDKRKNFLSRRFKIQGIPTLVAIGVSGKTITHNARELVVEFGAEAFPFTDEHVKQLEKKEDEDEEKSEDEDDMDEDEEEDDMDTDEEDDENEQEDKKEEKEGYICEGDVCRKV